MDDLKQNKSCFFPMKSSQNHLKGRWIMKKSQKHWSYVHQLVVPPMGSYILSGARFSEAVWNAYILSIPYCPIQFHAIPWSKIKQNWETKNMQMIASNTASHISFICIIWKQVWEQTTIEHLVDLPSCGLSVSSRKCWGRIYWFMWTGHIELIGRFNTFNHPGH